MPALANQRIDVLSVRLRADIGYELRPRKKVVEVCDLV